MSKGAQPTGGIDSRANGTPRDDHGPGRGGPRRGARGGRRGPLVAGSRRRRRSRNRGRICNGACIAASCRPRQAPIRWTTGRAAFAFADIAAGRSGPRGRARRSPRSRRGRGRRRGGRDGPARARRRARSDLPVATRDARTVQLGAARRSRREMAACSARACNGWRCGRSPRRRRRWLLLALFVVPALLARSRPGRRIAGSDGVPWSSRHRRPRPGRAPVAERARPLAVRRAPLRGCWPPACSPRFLFAWRIERRPPGRAAGGRWSP